MRTQEPTCPTHHCPTVVQVSGGLDTLPRGAVVGGRYKIVQQIGKGGFGAVYLATHQATQQELVLKVLKPDLSEDPTQVQRFFNEARASSLLSHPHTVRVFDFGQTDSGLLYIAMERLHGKELAHALKESGGKLPPLRAVRIAIGVLKSLAEAHHAGLVHRDLKPDNIFLCRVHGEDEFVKVIDFGIAKPKDSGDQNLTRTGFTVGTPKYMSPEQVLNKPLDGRSDLYALGVILYQALSGEVPLAGASPMETLMAHLQKEPEDLREKAPHLPPVLTRLVMRSLHKQPWERFTDADEMREALEEVLVVLEAADPVLRARTSLRMAAVTAAELEAERGKAALAPSAPAPQLEPAPADPARVAALRGQLITTEREMPASGPHPATADPADQTAALPRPALPAAQIPSARANQSASNGTTAADDPAARAQQETTLLSTPHVLADAGAAQLLGQRSATPSLFPVVAERRRDHRSGKVVWVGLAGVVAVLGAGLWWQRSGDAKVPTTQSGPSESAQEAPRLAASAVPSAAAPAPALPDAAALAVPAAAAPETKPAASGAPDTAAVPLRGEAALALLARLDPPLRRCAAGQLPAGGGRWRAVVAVDAQGAVADVRLTALDTTPEAAAAKVAECLRQTAPDPGLGAGPPRVWEGELPVADAVRNGQQPTVEQQRRGASAGPQLPQLPVPRKALPVKPRPSKAPAHNGDEAL